MKLRSLTLLPLAAALAVAPMMAHAENLMDAYRQAVANDPTLAQQLAQRNITGESDNLARAQLLPQLSANLTMQQVNGGTTPPMGHQRTRNESITLSQTVLDMSKWANLSAANAQVDSANATYEANLQDLIVRVTTAYFNVLTAQDAVTFAEADAKSLQRQLDQAQERFKVGLSAITDVQDAKAQYDSAKARLISSKNQLADTREALAVITGHPTNSLEVLSQELPMAPPQPAKLSAWVDQARLNNPNIAAQQFNVQSAEHSITASRDARLPTINASVGYGKFATWYKNGPYVQAPGSATISLTLKVPIFSGGGTRAQVKQSIYQRDSANAALTLQRRTVVRNTRNHFRSVIAGISEVEATRQAVLSNKSALDATRAGFQVGTRTIVDVLIAQQNLTQARQSYSQSRHQFILDKLLLEQDAGTLSVKDLKAVNALLVPPNSPAANTMPAATQTNSQPATDKAAAKGNTTKQH